MSPEVATITDPGALAHVGVPHLLELIRHRAPKLGARALRGRPPTHEEILDILRGCRPDDEASDLLDDLHEIARVLGCDDAEEIMRAKGMDLRAYSMGDALAHAAVHRRASFEAVCDHATVRAASKGSTFTQFVLRAGVTLSESITEAHRARLQGACSLRFDELGQGPHCEVRLYTEFDETGFLIDHAGARRAVRLINENEKPELRAVRPLRHDVVLVNRRTGGLRVLARTDGERLFYAQELGELLLSRKDAFVPDEKYVLDAICRPDYESVLSDLVGPSIERVTLREVKLVAFDDASSRIHLASQNVMSTLAATLEALGESVPTQASFSIVPRVRNGRRSFRVTICKGNRMKHNAPWSVRTVEDFIARLRLTRVAPT